MSMTVWDCNYCERVNPHDRFDCLGCGSPRLREQEYHVSEMDYHNEPIYQNDYFCNGGVSLRSDPFTFDRRMRDWLGG